MEATQPETNVAPEADEGKPISQTPYPKENPIAQAASLTAEGMTEYLDFIERLNTVGDISDNLAAYLYPYEIRHSEMAEFYGCLEIHIIPFLGKYGYPDLKEDIAESYDDFIKQVSLFDRSHEGRIDLSKKYLDFVITIDRVLNIVMKDFGFHERETDQDGGTDEDATLDPDPDPRALRISAPIVEGKEDDDISAKDVEDEEEKTEVKQENISLDLSKLSLGSTPTAKKD
ncbi:hypothetical protein TWF281_001334 [Arthrobotrys megalospora]